MLATHTFRAVSVKHLSTARTSAPYITRIVTRLRKDSGDFSGRVDERIRTVVGDVVARVSLPG